MRPSGEDGEHRKPAVSRTQGGRLRARCTSVMAGKPEKSEQHRGIYQHACRWWLRRSCGVRHAAARGADPLRAGARGRSALHAAVLSANGAAGEALLRSAASAELRRTLWDHADAAGEGALQMALRVRRALCICEILGSAATRAAKGLAGGVCAGRKPQTPPSFQPHEVRGN